MKRLTFAIIAALLLAALACNAPFTIGQGEPTPETSPSPEVTVSPTIELAPTLPPVDFTPTIDPDEVTPTEDPTPTELPPPTEIGEEGDEEEAGEEAEVALPTEGPGISIEPNLGEPGEVVVVEGRGFAPNITVTLHWGSTGGPTGPVAAEVETDDSGAFLRSVRVPEAAAWPGGQPKERDLLQLRAKYEKDFYYFANYTYLIRFNPQVPVLKFDNVDEGYSITVLNGWTWKWEEDFTDDVRFKSPSGKGTGFVRVETGTVNAVIPVVMGEEFPSQTYTTATSAVGKYPGTQATLSNGLIVVFIPSGNKVFVMSFTNDSGQNSLEVLGTFTFLSS